MDMNNNLHFETLQVHAGHSFDPVHGSCATAIHQSTSYAFKNSEHAEKLFNLEVPGHIYTRLSNPTVAVFEERIAELEGGSAAVACASGMASQFLTFQCIAQSGDNIIASPSLYGGTFNQLKVLPRFGIESRIAEDKHDPDSFERLIDENTKGIFVETIGNSDFHIPDFDRLARICEKYGIPFIVDNTFGAGGYLCRPKELGANIITHAATKWIGGHGNSIAGVVVDCGNFNWANGRFPLFTEPCQAYRGLSFWQCFGEGAPGGNTAFAVRARAEGLRDWGCCLSPFNAFLLLQGVETLSLRVQRSCDNALRLAEWLDANPLVKSVNYPGLKGNPNHANARKYLKNGFGAVLCIDIKGDRRTTARFVDSLKLITALANVGDNKTLITHPATTTHSQLSDKELIAAGISPTTLRISAGIENIEDIISDIEQALEKADIK